ncbi:ATP-dependent RNA helicase suv3, mitochondrial [Psilocybe cubensis]|uniref:RNA helicase n=2 Tax=Psilocybe cubensis TaxID=181762 RepID=A0A8H7Y139_PSICU|nr:ATP-dependent RNA helicase suv3, mitochondrial [Psilocybe cubensis]KAH9483464.1 ATP-dependent RNA helicase suv3, mitochondrial [Psilocybe cubensis]
MLRSLNASSQLSLTQCIRPERWIGVSTLIFRRYRSGGHSKRKPQINHAKGRPSMDLRLDHMSPRFEPPQHPWRASHHSEFRGNHRDGFGHVTKPAVIPVISKADELPYFHDNVASWTENSKTQERLALFGIPGRDARKLLDTFVDDVEAGFLSGPKEYIHYGLERFSHQQDDKSIDVIYSTIFFSWASRPENLKRLETQFGVQTSTLDRIASLTKATNREFLGDEFPQARTFRRKFIMHVGPTNSGKTHHALRALAAAHFGVYAGPLRLLAHEIWHRLNTGQIVPLGVEVDPNDKAAYGPKPEYIRSCNMITGEEQKMVEGATLLSCTVEMLSYATKYDVAVIDEIQMIGDDIRGGGWTSAVLGLVAKEIHLCGEETAIPVVQNLLEHTGDELIVKRYERLTPLTVENKSLQGDVTNVRKGDCIVTFSRRSIFDLKKTVENRTGLKCAVVYGRLPPEVRSEQASLFNDPDSGFDVMIGSDAIGMGLNLKIKRVIFEALSKRQGGATISLPVSSIKQIAGRAGRYGLHDSDSGGTTTTLFDGDLRRLRKTLPMPYQPLSFARIGIHALIVAKALAILPPGTTVRTAVSASEYIGRIPTHVRYMEFSQTDQAYDFIDKEWPQMSIEDKVQVLYAPIPWRDIHTTRIIKRLLRAHQEKFSVTLQDINDSEPFMDTMESIERHISKLNVNEQPMTKHTQSRAKFKASLDKLNFLESFHKILVFYSWMSLRNSVVYADSSVETVKERLEDVLNWVLVDMSRDGTSSATELEDVRPALITPELLPETNLQHAQCAV